MTDKKRNIISVIEQEHNYLDNILDAEEFKDFKKLTSELKDTWHKKQLFRTETEMRVSVLDDGRYPNKAAKYWQCVREQNVFLENLMALSFDHRKNDIEIKKTQIKIKKEKDMLEKELLQIELDQKIYGKANMELTAKDRMREINLWSNLKKEFNDGTFDTKNVDTHQAVSLKQVLEHKKSTITQGTSQNEVFNIVSQLESVYREEKEGAFLKNKKFISKK
jgi:hypothetical protein|tara:strand:- start:2097 stop:2759 length:663 start_codon:yes stop_codon:yes gene_type:complete